MQPEGNEKYHQRNKRMFLEYIWSRACPVIIVVVLLFVVRLIVYDNIVLPQTRIVGVGQENATAGWTPFDPIVILSGSDEDAPSSPETEDYPDPSEDDILEMAEGSSFGLDDYKSNVEACEDFYSKVCSLYDDPLPKRGDGNEEFQTTTGTFKRVIEESEELVNSLVREYPQFHQCTSYLSKKENSSIASSDTRRAAAAWMEEKKLANPKSFYDLWSMGIQTIFTVTPASKKMDSDHFSTDFDVDFSRLVKLMLVGREEYSVDGFSLFERYHALVDYEAYPNTYEKLIAGYQKVRDVRPDSLKKALKDGFRLEDGSYVNLNGQHLFFQECFAPDDTEGEDAFRKLAELGLATVAAGETLDQYGESAIAIQYHVRCAVIEVKIKKRIDALNVAGWSHANPSYSQSHRASWTEGEDPEEVCGGITRDTFFEDVNAKYYYATGSPAKSKDVHRMVKDVLDVSKEFFSERDKRQHAVPESVRRVSDITADKAFRKMNLTTIVSMASTPMEFVNERSAREIAYLGRFTYPEVAFESTLWRRKDEQQEIARKRVSGYESHRRDLDANARSVWISTKAETVNAWYNPSINSITIPLGIVRYPIFRDDYDYDVAMFDAIVGHELGHATDSGGKYFDEKGNYVDGTWWNPEDADGLLSRSQCLAEDYGHPCGNAVYGEHTLGEDMADQFGMRMVLMLNERKARGDFSREIDRNASWVISEANSRRKTLDQDAFVNFARLWCGRSTFSSECRNVRSDVHALAKHRVIKTLRQFDTFARVFSCNENDGMVSRDKCLVY